MDLEQSIIVARMGMICLHCLRDVFFRYICKGLNQGLFRSILRIVAKMSLNKAKNIFLIALPLLVAFVLYLVLSEKPYVYLGNLGEELGVLGYSDADKDGDSEIAVEEMPSIHGAEYSYSLGERKEYPYAGLMIFNRDSSFVDLSKYNYCDIELKATLGQQIPFYIFTNIPDYSTWKNPSTFLNLQYFIDIDTCWTVATVPFKRMVVPGWWHTLYNQNIDVDVERRFSETAILNFANCVKIPRSVKDTITVRSVVFYYDMSLFFAVLPIALLVYYSVLFLVLKYLKAKTTTIKQPVFTYEKIETVNYADKEATAVFDFLESNFHIPELSVTDVQEATGVSERKIASVVKSHSELNFKQFLNSLRISETKRLLLETDLPISEIAFKTGYNNISHFNRVFKQAMGVSPGVYRKSNVQ